VSPSFIEKLLDPEGEERRRKLARERQEIEDLEERHALAARRARIEGELAKTRASGTEAALSDASEGSRGGRTRDEIIDAAIANREPDGTWPTQAAVAMSEALGIDPRRIRQLQGPRGWKGILADAQARVAGR
jgi:hypothetical protein